MKCCMFCSNEAEMMLFNHMTNDIGSLCLDCFMKLQGSCAICNESFMPEVVQEGGNYRVEAKFVGMGEKNIIVCDRCYVEIKRMFPKLLA